jgi:hypothetical protein
LNKTKAPAAAGAFSFEGLMAKRRSSRYPQSASEILFIAVVFISALLYSNFQHKDLFTSFLCMLPVVLVGFVVVLVISRIIRSIQRKARQQQLASAWLRAMFDLYPDDDPISYPKELGLLDWDELERLCARTYSHLGYRTELVGGSGDQGIDVRLKKGGEVTAVVQCKQYAGAVPPNLVRELNGARLGLKGIFWAPSGYTDQARSWAEENCRGNVELVNGQGILQLVERAYMPISTVPVKQPAPLPTPIVPSRFINPNALAPFDVTKSDPILAPSSFDPLHLEEALPRLAKRLGLTVNQLYILFAIMCIGAISITIMAVSVVIMTR